MNFSEFLGCVTVCLKLHIQKNCVFESIKDKILHTQQLGYNQSRIFFYSHKASILMKHVVEHLFHSLLRQSLVCGYSRINYLFHKK